MTAFDGGDVGVGDGRSGARDAACDGRFGFEVVETVVGLFRFDGCETW